MSGSSTITGADCWDRVLQALAAQPRRQLVVSLLDADEDLWLALPEAAMASGHQGQEVTDIELWHRHLPVLSEPGYVEWREKPFSVRRGANFEEIGTVMEGLLRPDNDYPPELVDRNSVIEQHLSDG